MWIKICANTNLEDTLTAASLGADAVGFVFAPSSRQVTPAQVTAISRALPPEIERVGVFCAETVEEIVNAIEQAELTAVQMHGGVNLAFAKQLQERLGRHISIIQTAHWKVDEDEASELELASLVIEVASDPTDYRLLVDAQIGKASGGLGVPFDWTRARKVFANSSKARLIVAGGLTPENVSNAVAELKPWGVDVASGVEREPGKKDFAKLRAFIQSARRA